MSQVFEEKVRLEEVRYEFVGRESHIDLDGLEDRYVEWRDFVEYMLIQHQVFRRGNVKKNTIAIKCNKRGNDVYFFKLAKKLDSLWLRKDVDFFEVRGNAKFCRMLFVTLTYKRGLKSLSSAWCEIGEEFNVWITGVRQRFGKVSYVRCWEAFKSGFPHIHVLLYFQEVSFRVRRMWSRDKAKWVYRVLNVKPLSVRMVKKWRGFVPESLREVRDMFGISWNSFVDVEGVESFNSGVHYVTKYMTKWAMSVRTLSLCWIFMKRSFSVSGDFNDLISNYNSNSNRVRRVQVSIDTATPIQIVEYWVFIGVYSSGKLGINPKKWVSRVNLDEFVLVERLNRRFPDIVKR